ncbi:MAG: hypothetical protein ACOCP8_00795 [archaeon]
MAENINNFENNSSFNRENNFTSVRFGHDKPLIEVELNEMQQIQEEKNLSLSRTLLPTGVIPNKSYNNSILYSPSKNNIWQMNHIGLAPFTAIVNGYKIPIEGDFTPTEINDNKYILLDLGEAPSEGYREDLVYLEVWFEMLTGYSQLKKWGNINNENNIQNNIIDSRVNEETSRRIGMLWDIKVAKDIDFSIFPEIKFKNETPLFAKCRGISPIGATINPDLQFEPATKNIFKNCSFYNDPNLWIAGRPDNKIDIKKIYGNFVYLMPLLKIKRRNKLPYSIFNYNGSNPNPLKDNFPKSVENGDMYFSNDLQVNYNTVSGYHIRPDNLKYNHIVSNDIIDLRKNISLSKDYNKLLNEGINDLFKGKLKSDNNIKMKRAQFGNFNINNQNLHYNEIILYNTFNNTLDSTIGNNDYLYNNISDIIYKDSILEKGLLVNGENKIIYNLPVPLGNTSNGGFTIDFYLQPLWDNDSGEQEIIKLVDNNTNSDVITFKKQDNSLKIIYNSSNPNINYEIIIDLNKGLIIENNIYHIRMSFTAESDLILYINGNPVKIIDINNSDVNPNEIEKLIIGGINENIINGCIIENLVIYNNYFEEEIDGKRVNNYWPELSKDFIDKKSNLLPSFNGYYKGFKEGNFVDEKVVTKCKVIDGKILLNVPEGSIIDDQIEPIVYGLSYNDFNGNNINISGQIISSIWNGLGTNNAKFILDQHLSPKSVDEPFIEHDLRKLHDYNGQNYKNDLLNNNDIIIDNLDEIINCNYEIIVSDVQTKTIKIIEKHINNDIQKYHSTIENNKDIEINGIIFKVNSLIEKLNNDDFINGDFIILNVKDNGDYEFLQNMPIAIFNEDLKNIISDNNLAINNYDNVRDGSYQIIITNIASETTDDTDIDTFKIIDIESQEVLYDGELGTNFTQIPGLIFDYQELHSNAQINDSIVISTSITEPELIVQYNLNVLNIDYNYNVPCDLPHEILRAGKILPSSKFKEIICNKEPDNGEMFVEDKHYLKPRVSTNSLKRDYYTIYSLKNRPNYLCGTQLLHYYIDGNNTNAYSIPSKLYGRNVLNIYYCDRKLKNVTIIKNGKYPNGETYLDQYGQPILNSDGTPFNGFDVELVNDVTNNQLIVFELMLGGLTFDYNPYNKTYMSNMHEAKIIEFKATGERDDIYIIPCCNNNGGGILKAVSSIIEDKNDPSTRKYTCYLDNIMMRQQYANNFTLLEDSIGTPFLKIKLNQDVEVDTLIKVPVLVSYQPNHDEIFSLWYNYLPYQGILTNKTKTVKRITDWKYFITTLGSGKISLNIDEDNQTSLNNIIDRLPGGHGNAMYIKGEPIKFKHLIDTFNNQDINKELIFTNEILFSADNNNNLDNNFKSMNIEFKLKKNSINYQDSTIEIEDNKFGIYLPDCYDSITKYIGMTCLVVDENGEILLLVLGNLDRESSTTNKLIPKYGDLFKLNNLPILNYR